MKIIALLIIISLSSCVRTTTITTSPEKARCYIGKDFVGYTPVTLTLSPSANNITLETEGYKTTKVTLKRYFDAKSFFIIPFMFLPQISTQLGDNYQITLKKTDKNKFENLGVIHAVPDTPKVSTENE